MAVDPDSNWVVLLTPLRIRARKLAGALMLLYLGRDGAQQGGIRVFGKRGNPPVYNAVDRCVTEIGYNYSYPLPTPLHGLWYGYTYEQVSSIPEL